MQEFSEGHRSFAAGGDDCAPIDYLVPVLAEMAKSGQITREEIQDVEDVLDEIGEVSLHPTLIMEMIPRFVAYQRTRREILGVSEGDLDSPESIAGNLTSIYRRARAMSSGQGDRPTRAMDLLQTFLPNDDKEVIGVGLDSVDSMLGGGLPVGQAGMICAYTGYGKSSFGLHICQRNARIRKHSTFFSFEMPAEQLMCRYVSSLIGYPYDLIWKGDYTGVKSRTQINEEVQEELERRIDSDATIRNALEFLDICEIIDRTPTFLDVEAKLEKLREEGKDPKLAVADYLEIMGLPQTKEFDAANKDTRDKIGEMSKQLTSVFGSQRVAGWILTQANDEGNKNTAPGLTAARDSRKKNDPISIWCSLGGSEAQLSEGIFNFRCAKNRDGDKFKIKIRGDGATQTFYDYDQNSDMPAVGAASRRAEPGTRSSTLEEDFA